MQYVNLGATGLKVSRLCLGAMNFLKKDTSTDEGIRVIHAAIDQGINFIDTADCYVDSELIVGEALKDRRDRVVLTTKCWAKWSGSDWPNDGGSSRYHIFDSCEKSLKRLQTDHIDLLLIHRPDWEWPGAPAAETLGALTDLVRQGKVRYIGSSCYPAWKLVEYQWTSKHHGLERFCCDQLNYSIANRYVENDVLPICGKYGIGVTIYSPLHEGWLTGKFRRGQAPPEGSRMSRRFRAKKPDPNLERDLDIVEGLAPLCEQVGVPMVQFALAWLLKNPLVTSLVLGPRNLEQLEQSLPCLDVELDDTIMAAVDEISPPGGYGRAEYPPIRKWIETPGKAHFLQV